MCPGTADYTLPDPVSGTQAPRRRLALAGLLEEALAEPDVLVQCVDLESGVSET